MQCRFLKHLQKEIMADKFTFTSLLSACATEAVIKKGKHLHACILYSEVKLDVFLGTALLKMYGNCGMVEVAQKLFNNMTEPTLILWNALIAVYTQCGCNKEALAVFHQMQQERLIPDKVTHANALSACANELVVLDGKEMHACIVESGCLSDIVVGTALVNMYGNCGKLEEGRIIFDRMPRHNVVCWNAIMAVYSQHGHGEVILQFFDQMQEEVVPDDLTFVSILSGCSHSGLVENGLHCFASIHQVYGIAPTIVHYVCVIDLLGRAGQLDKAEGLMNCISCLNNTVSFTALLGACKCSAGVERGELVVKEILKVYPDRASPSVMLNKYVICCWQW